MAHEIDIPSMFKDVTPIPQDDGPHPVCAIDYKPSFVECMDYLRAVMYFNELSERALKLTTVCLKHNPANYTTWHFRRQCLIELSKATSIGVSCCDVGKFDPEIVKSDLEFTSDLGGSNPKNYQIWYHRRALLEPTLTSVGSGADGRDLNEMTPAVYKSVRDELMYINKVLESDAKNYHAWSHRQWIVRKIDDDDIWGSEEEYCHSLLLADIRNNSAWNHRWFATHRGRRLPLPMERAREEAAYGFDCVVTDPFNESSWRYVLGIINEQITYGNAYVLEQDLETSRENTFSAVDFVREYEENVRKIQSTLNDSDHPRLRDGCSNLMSAHVELLEAKGDEDSLKQAIEIIQSLAQIHDKIRLKYWNFREREIRSQLESKTFAQ